MAHRLRIRASALCCLLFLASACSSNERDSSGEDAATPESPPTAEDLDELATTVEEPGAWAVGTRTVDVAGARGRTLPLQVWYPVNESVAATADPATYDFPGIVVPSGMAVADAPPADGDFPLVIYSHGNGGLRYVSSFLTEHLASHGFVVMAPSHVGNTAIDSFAGTSDETTQVALDRPEDVSAVIDAATTGVPGTEDLVGVTDVENLSVIGHSFGGYTALALAGGVGDAQPDERVDAIVGLAAASSRMDDETLTAVEVPTLLLSATSDETTPVAENTERPAELIRGRPLVRADLDGAGHQSFTDVCDYQEIARSLPELPALLVDAVDEYAIEGCAPELLDIDEAHRLTNRLTTAFLLEHLYGDDDYSPLLAAPADEGEPLAVLERTD